MRIEPLLLFFALSKIGVISVNLYPSMDTDQLIEILTNIKCKGIFISDGSDDYESLVSGNEPSIILLSSGSTGKHKLIVQNQWNLVNNGMENNKRIGFNQDDILGNFVKLFHLSPKLNIVMTILEGATMVISPDNDITDPLLMLKVIDRNGITTLNSAPSIYSDIITHPKFKLYNVSTIKKGMIGSILMTQEIGELVRREFGNGIIHFYGMSEILLVSSTSPDYSENRFINTVGKIFDNCSAKIINSQGEVVEIGVIGEILIKCKSQMLEYYRNPIKTSETIDIDGWVHTGDVGKIDPDENLIILGRMEDIIFLNENESITPKEIEDTLNGHPKIKEIQVFGIPNDDFNLKFQEISAWVKLKPNYQTLSIDELKSYYEEQKKPLNTLPHHIEIVDEIIFNENAKPLKRVMREKTIQKRLKNKNEH
eukprot:gene3237-4051_t